LKNKALRDWLQKLLQPTNHKSLYFRLAWGGTSEGIKWLERRVIPKNRIFVGKILKTLNLSVGNIKDIIDVCKGLSLNNSYWLCHGTFAQYNLYENRFSEILSLVAYAGIGQNNEAFSTSPELTTSGMLPKAWRLIETDEIYLYKGHGKHGK